ncbi:hypothetical protein AB0O07_35690 [Streptomyces sp. NPDC093085]|uniref:hypothetical protein n=1 Tax=Streptomyces sp. NPDC093085 TaxID=3155068 RepID=UPI003440F23A
MTRINRPDTLLTELRDIKRRLHALETAQRASATPRSTTPTAMGENTAATGPAPESGNGGTEPADRTVASHPEQGPEQEQEPR